jgi:hypothetical protein
MDCTINLDDIKHSTTLFRLDGSELETFTDPIRFVRLPMGAGSHSLGSAAIVTKFGIDQGLC